MGTSQKKIVVGVMGPGSLAVRNELRNAYELGSLIGKQENWILLTGGSKSGVMDEALRGAKTSNPKCTTIGILSCRSEEIEKISEFADIKVPTGMGEGRNYLNVVTSDFIVFCCNEVMESFGTLSELTFAMKHNKPIVFLTQSLEAYPETFEYYRNIFKSFRDSITNFSQEIITDSPERVIKLIQEWNQSKNI